MISLSFLMSTTCRELFPTINNNYFGYSFFVPSFVIGYFNNLINVPMGIFGLDDQVNTRIRFFSLIICWKLFREPCYQMGVR